MYSMKRTMCPVPRKRRAMSSTWVSLTPRLTTMFTLIGASPAAAAASMPSSTFATGKSTSFMARNVASSSESRLTVMRSEPLVVRVRSTAGSASRSIATRRSMSLRNRGSPPVRRIFSVPMAWKARATRTISSNDRISACGRNAWSASKTSFGMQ